VKKSKKILNLLLIALLAVGMTLTGCSKKQNPAESLVLTVNEQNVYLNEMMYYIYAVEASGAQWEQMYQTYYNSSYWDTEYEEGKTMRDQAKEYVMDTAIKYEIIYDKAVKADYTLTEDEKLQAESNAATILSEMTEDVLKITGFTKEILTKVQEKLMLGEKYYSKVVEDLAIDNDAIKDSIKFDDYKQYNTEYIFAATSKMDESYNAVELSDEEKAAAKTAVTDALEKVKEGAEFADIVKDNDTLTTADANFVYEDGSMETEYQDAAMKLENGDVTDSIIETETGYYIIKMVDNNSSESYDTAVSDAIATAEDEGFTAEYNKMKEDYTTTINAKVWDSIKLGNITIVATTESEDK
jgi:foldase protein PrsA